jgi:hypothetical protein
MAGVQTYGAKWRAGFAAISDTRCTAQRRAYLREIRGNGRSEAAA